MWRSNGLRFSGRQGAGHRMPSKQQRSRAPKAVSCKRLLDGDGSRLSIQVLFSASFLLTSGWSFCPLLFLHCPFEQCIMRTQALYIGGILQSRLEQVQQEWRVDALCIEWIERCALARCRVVRIPKPFGIEGDTFPAIIDRRQYHTWLGWRDDIDEHPPAIAGCIRTIGFQKAVLTVRQTGHAAHRDRPHFVECAIAKIAMEGCHRHCVRPSSCADQSC